MVPLVCRYALHEADVLCQVQNALSLVGMQTFLNRTTHTLSGGQKQRVAIAGALAESPKVPLPINLLVHLLHYSQPPHYVSLVSSSQSLSPLLRLQLVLYVAAMTVA